jgi:hypothetical protein
MNKHKPWLEPLDDDLGRPTYPPAVDEEFSDKQSVGMGFAPIESDNPNRKNTNLC